MIYGCDVTETYWVFKKTGTFDMHCQIFLF